MVPVLLHVIDDVADSLVFQTGGELEVVKWAGGFLVGLDVFQQVAGVVLVELVATLELQTVDVLCVDHVVVIR